MRSTKTGDLALTPIAQILANHFHEKDELLRTLRRFDAAMVQSAQLKATPVPTNSDAKRSKLRPVESFLDLGSVFHLEELRKHMEECSSRFQVDYLEMALICNSTFNNMESGTCNANFGFPSKTMGWPQLHMRGYEPTMRVLGELAYLVRARST
jgi:hypothetical protein